MCCISLTQPIQPMVKLSTEVRKSYVYGSCLLYTESIFEWEAILKIYFNTL